jgi:hypothetical protein
MNVVHINGVALLPGIDYSVGKTTLSFSVPPPSGSDIIFTEVINDRTGATHMTRLTGDGFTYLFKLETNFTDRVELQELFSEVMKHKDIPAVRDALDKLKVIVELVKQDATVY